MKTNEIELYNRIVVFYDILKDVQQLSWKISQLNKRYPLESSTKEQYIPLLKSYIGLCEQVDSIAHVCREELNDEGIQKLLNE